MPVSFCDTHFPRHRVLDEGNQYYSCLLPVAVRLLHKVVFNSQGGSTCATDGLRILRGELRAYLVASGAGEYAGNRMKVQMRSFLWGNTANKGDTEFQLKL